MKNFIFTFIVAVFASMASMSAQAQQSSDAAKFLESHEADLRGVHLDRWFALTQTPTQKQALVKCQKTPQRLWFIANVGTIKHPVFKGFCRIARPVSPFVDIG